MNNVSILLLLFLTFFIGEIGLHSEDYHYQVTGMYETDARGQVLQQSPARGSLLLQGNGLYKLDVHIQDSGSYKYVKANPNQANDTIYFQSNNNFQFFAYPMQGNLAIWVKKTETGRDLWYHAQLSRGNTESQTPRPAAENILNLIENGVFTRTVLYGKTSAPSYNWYNREDGSYEADEGNVILRSNGTFYIKSEIGTSLLQYKGTYKISGSQVSLVLSDGSSMIMTLVDGGKSLHWKSQGMLIAEYTILGFIK